MEHVQTSFIPVLIIHIYSCTRSFRTLSLHRCRLRHRKYRNDLRDISHFHWNGSVLPHMQRRFPRKHLLMRYRLHRLFRGLRNFRNRCSVLRLLRVPPPECRLCSNSRLHYCRCSFSLNNPNIPYFFLLFIQICQTIAKLLLLFFQLF